MYRTFSDGFVSEYLFLNVCCKYGLHTKSLYHNFN